MKHTNMTPIRLSAIVLACLVATGCASISPLAASVDTLQNINNQDRAKNAEAVEPIIAPLSMEAALARALKYNLERRSRLMEEALAMGQLSVTKYEMLPRVMANAGYSSKDKARFTYSSTHPSETPNKDNTASTSAERDHSTTELGLSWSLLDFGLGYYNSKQQADRVLVASEKRRKATHLLMQDVRLAYWRAASAQLLRDDVAKTIKLAEEALADSRKVEAERVRNPLEPLRFQRQLLENLRLLESINQELSSAQVDLATLINAPLNQPIVLAATESLATTDPLSSINMGQLEEVALINNADLREQHYNARIARDETRRTMMRLFPNITFSYDYKYDSDNYLLHNRWNETGVQLSFNLMNIFTGASQMKLTEAGVALAEHRRMTTQMSVLAQVHLARLEAMNARNQFLRADAIYDTDKKIAEIMRNRASAQAQSKLDMVSSETASILSLLRRYQALAQVQVAENRMLATLGLEPYMGDTNLISLKELTTSLTHAQAPWEQLRAGKALPKTAPGW